MSFCENMLHYLKAGFPCLSVETHEEDRVEREILRVSEEAKRTFFRWSVTEGWVNSNGDIISNVTDPLAAVKAVEKLPDFTIAILRDFHFFVDDPQVVRTIRDLIPKMKATGKTLVFQGCRFPVPQELQKEVTHLQFNLPTRKELDVVLSGILESVTKEVKIGDRTRLLDAAVGLTQAEAENAFALALVKHGNLQEAAVRTVQSEKAGVVKKSGVLDFYESEELIEKGMTLLGGMNALKDFVNRRGKAFSDEARAFGLPVPRGVIVWGVPGCGKSLAAKVTAAHWKVPCLRADFGRLFGSLVGQSEAQMRTMLQLAEAVAPCVLWVDEFEKGLAGLSSSGVTDSGVTSRVFETFLVWLSEKTAPVFVFATANDVTKLPPEILRSGRFDERFFVDLPSPQEREEIFGIHLSKRNRDPKKFDLAKLAAESDQFSGAEIEECVVSALFEAFDWGKDISTEGVLQAIRNTKPLAVTMREKVDAIRKWSEGRARRATEITAGAKTPVRRLAN